MTFVRFSILSLILLPIFAQLHQNKFDQWSDWEVDNLNGLRLGSDGHWELAHIMKNRGQGKRESISIHTCGYCLVLD